MAPGWIASSGMDTYQGEFKEQIPKLKGYCPIGRLGTESEVSGAVCFLLSDAADNRFFARSGHWPYFAHPGDWMNRFYDLPEDPMSFKGMTYAFIRAFISARIGLLLGNYLLRLKR